MHFVRAGRGAPPLVFVHGFACRLEDWRAQLHHFEKNHAVVACDLRGHGETPGRPHECTIAHYGGDVAALVNHLELNGCILVGHSMGTRVVLEANRLVPERIAGIVLVDGSRSGTGDPDAAEASARATIEKAGYPAFAGKLLRRGDRAHCTYAASKRGKNQCASQCIALRAAGHQRKHGDWKQHVSDAEASEHRLSADSVG